MHLHKHIMLLKNFEVCPLKQRNNVFHFFAS